MKETLVGALWLRLTALYADSGIQRTPAEQQSAPQPQSALPPMQTPHPEAN